MRSDLRGPPLSITVTLTPIRGAGEARTITLTPGEPCLVGRASRSALKNLKSRNDNALFDCPVISRRHAELRAHLWNLVENQVTVTDKGSMHGTRVNGQKLREGQPKTLRAGDHIQFGEKVTSGDSSHEAVLVTFSHRQNFSQDSSTLPAHTKAAKASGFCYPYTSDEESDYESDDNLSAVNGGRGFRGTSSAKTTPERTETKLGSSEQPIDLEQPEKSKKTLVQVSLDAQASVIVPESIPVAQEKITLVAVSDNEEDDHALVKQDSTMSQPTANRPRATSYVSVEQDSDVHPYIEETEEMNNISDSDASDLNPFNHRQPSDDEEDDEHFDRRSPSPELPRESSPELRSSGQSQPAELPSIVSGSFTHPAATVNSAFGKPQNIQSGRASRWDILPTSQSTTYPRAYDAYSQSTFANFDHPFSNPYPSAAGGINSNYHSLPGNTRWDKQPHYPRVEPSFSGAFGTAARDTGFPSADPFVFSHNWNDTPSVDVVSNLPVFPVAGNGYYPQSPKFSPVAAATTGRISIPDIVENENDVVDGTLSAGYPNVAEDNENMLKEARAMVEQAEAMVAENAQTEETINPSLPTPTNSMGTKRKADDIEHDASVTFTDDFTMHGTLPGVPGDRHTTEIPSLDHMDLDVTPPAAKKSKTSKDTSSAMLEARNTTSALVSASSLAASIAKYTAVASAGGAGMLAFLCSPASERLLNWLS